MNGEDSGWLSQLWAAHAAKLYGYAARRVGTQHAEDVVAATFVVAWRKREHRPDHELPWLYGVARRVIADHYRAERRRGELADRIAAQPTPSTSSGDDQTVEVALAAQSAAQALASLSERDREVLLLVAWEQLGVRDAAAAMGVSVTAFRMRLSRARRRLATALDSDQVTTLRPVKRDGSRHEE